MPGSRFQELEQLTTPMLSAIRTIKARYSNMQVILPLAAPHLRPALHQLIAREGMTEEIHIITSNVYTCLNRCELLMLSSGTATLEAALLGVPMVVAYRVSPVTYLVGRKLIKSRFIAMPNILLDERVVPELIQQQVTAEQLASHALMILENPEHARSIRSKLSAIRPMLGKEGVLDAVARFILDQAIHAFQSSASIWQA
jgi:lipid-A-disaccharide synthase